MNTFKLTVSSPDGNIFVGDVIKLDIRGTEGELAVMAGHIPFVTSVIKSPFTIWLPDGSKKSALTVDGLLTVSTDSVIFISEPFKFEQ